MNGPEDFDDDLGGQPDDCPNCGGEGVIYDCFDGMCVDAESGCDLCERECDWCSPARVDAARGK